MIGGGIATGEKVKTREDVQRIKAASNKVRSLSSAFQIAMRQRDTIRAAQLSREASRIKNGILAEYDIIL